MYCCTRTYANLSSFRASTPILEIEIHPETSLFSIPKGKLKLSIFYRIILLYHQPILFIEQCCGSEIIFFRIRIKLFRKFRIRIRFWRQFILCLRILDRPGLNCNAINLKISQLIGLIVVYNLWKFEIDSLQIDVRTSSSDPDPKLIITDPDPANNFGSDRNRIHNTGCRSLSGYSKGFQRVFSL